MFIKVFDFYQEVLGDNHPDNLLYIEHFADILSSRGRYDFAILLMQECFKKEEFGPW